MKLKKYTNTIRNKNEIVFIKRKDRIYFSSDFLSYIYIKDKKSATTLFEAGIFDKNTNNKILPQEIESNNDGLYVLFHTNNNHRSTKVLHYSKNEIRCAYIGITDINTFGIFTNIWNNNYQMLSYKRFGNWSKHKKISKKIFQKKEMSLKEIENYVYESTTNKFLVLTNNNFDTIDIPFNYIDLNTLEIHNDNKQLNISNLKKKENIETQEHTPIKNDISNTIIKKNSNIPNNFNNKNELIKTKNIDNNKISIPQLSNNSIIYTIYDGFPIFLNRETNLAVYFTFRNCNFDFIDMIFKNDLTIATFFLSGYKRISFDETDNDYKFYKMLATVILDNDLNLLTYNILPIDGKKIEKAKSDKHTNECLFSAYSTTLMKYFKFRLLKREIIKKIKTNN